MPICHQKLRRPTAQSSRPVYLPRSPLVSGHPRSWQYLLTPEALASLRVLYRQKKDLLMVHH